MVINVASNGGGASYHCRRAAAGRYRRANDLSAHVDGVFALATVSQQALRKPITRSAAAPQRVIHSFGAGLDPTFESRSRRAASSLAKSVFASDVVGYASGPPDSSGTVEAFASPSAGADLNTGAGVGSSASPVAPGVFSGAGVRSQRPRLLTTKGTKPSIQVLPNLTTDEKTRIGRTYRALDICRNVAWLTDGTCQKLAPSSKPSLNLPAVSGVCSGCGIPNVHLDGYVETGAGAPTGSPALRCTSCANFTCLDCAKVCSPATRWILVSRLLVISRSLAPLFEVHSFSPSLTCFA